MIKNKTKKDFILDGAPPVCCVEGVELNILGKYDRDTSSPKIRIKMPKPSIIIYYYIIIYFFAKIYTIR